MMENSDARRILRLSHWCRSHIDGIVAVGTAESETFVGGVDVVVPALWIVVVAASAALDLPLFPCSFD